MIYLSSLIVLIIIYNIYIEYNRRKHKKNNNINLIKAKNNMNLFPPPYNEYLIIENSGTYDEHLKIAPNTPIFINPKGNYAAHRRDKQKRKNIKLFKKISRK
jgi:hypothetical protein